MMEIDRPETTEEKVVLVRVKEAASQNLVNIRGHVLSIYFAGLNLHSHFARATEEVGKGVLRL